MDRNFIVDYYKELCEQIKLMNVLSGNKNRSYSYHQYESTCLICTRGLDIYCGVHDFDVAIFEPLNTFQEKRDTIEKLLCDNNIEYDFINLNVFIRIRTHYIPYEQKCFDAINKILDLTILSR